MLIKSLWYEGIHKSLNWILPIMLTVIILKFVAQLFPVLLGIKRSPYLSFTGLDIGLSVNGDPGELRRIPTLFLYSDG